MDKKTFAERLAQLRTEKGISARDMSLSIGQSPNYITSIESGRNLPSMTAFFYICEYLHITPVEFFDTENKGWMRSAKGVLRYYDSRTGAMYTGFQKVAGKYYYFNKKTKEIKNCFIQTSSLYKAVFIILQYFIYLM